jgi:phosphonate transport system substrate-binding protein
MGSYDSRSTSGRKLAAALLAIAVAVAARGAEEKALVLAVVPNKPPVALHKAWSPFVAELSRAAGVRIELKLYDRVDIFWADCNAGVPDLLYAPPNMFFLLHRKQGYLALVRARAMLTGVIFVRKDSPLTSIRELHGKTIAFVGPKNICSVLTRHALATSGTPVEFNASFSGSTLNVAKAVLLGKAEAGATLDGALVADGGDTLDQLRPIFETPPVASHPLAAHPRVPREVRERIAAAVLALAGSDEGQRLLAGVRLSDPIRADYARDYRSFDSVDFERLERQERSVR